MNISSLITKVNNSFKIGQVKNQPTTEEFINRGFAPINELIDIMFLFPPTSIGKDYSHRYGKKDLGDLKGDLIPLGVASLAAYLREYGFGVGALDCIALELTHDDIVEIIDETKSGSILPNESAK